MLVPPYSTKGNCCSGHADEWVEPSYAGNCHFYTRMLVPPYLAKGNCCQVMPMNGLNRMAMVFKALSLALFLFLCARNSCSLLFCQEMGRRQFCVVSKQLWAVGSMTSIRRCVALTGWMPCFYFSRNVFFSTAAMYSFSYFSFFSLSRP